MAVLERGYHRAGGARVHAILMVFSASLGLAGCGSISMPLGNWTSSTPDITGSTTQRPSNGPALALAYETLGDSDWEEVRKTVASSLFSPVEARLEWSNARTGTNGTITGLVATRARNGASCRHFTTTMAKVDGVRLYRAEACQGYAGEWEIVQTAPVDARS